MMENQTRQPMVAVAMSGGVDSSVAACLLSEQGYSVVGLTMKLFCYGDDSLSDRSCCNLKSVSDARAVCDTIGAPHYVIDSQEVFKREVIDCFVSSYLQGRTPNPCVECNSRLKFSFLWNMARKLGADYLATGHYARLLLPAAADTGIPSREQDASAVPKLARGSDPDKDQTYFLWGIPRTTLSRFIFPLGELRKAEVRGIAEKHGLAVAQKIESQEVCFMDSSSVEDFIRGYKNLPEESDPGHSNTQPGPLVDREGNTLGYHRGAAFYTVGQRKGLGVALGRPAYVTGIDPQTNTVVVGDKADLLSDSLTASKVNYLIEPPAEPFPAQVKIRYRHKAVPARVYPESQGRVRVVLEQPQHAITPGQSVVFYDNEVVLGGGVIEDAGKSRAEVR